ncbi:hypothetical protein, partial [Pseudomonas viridiflava]|uniref:hypothetical protein n=1 Tax=Pseudomonas viridiflava TaxID=33069 RepID=UPI00197E1E3F
FWAVVVSTLKAAHHKFQLVLAIPSIDISPKESFCRHFIKRERLHEPHIDPLCAFYHQFELRLCGRCSDLWLLTVELVWSALDYVVSPGYHCDAESNTF